MSNRPTMAALRSMKRELELRLTWCRVNNRAYAASECCAALAMTTNILAGLPPVDPRRQAK